MAEVPVIQILDKSKIWSQVIVPLPNEVSPPPLAPSSLRVRSEIFSLTSNNFTYAKLGTLFGWWNFHPLPKSTPAPYNDQALYGRTNCWGYGRVLGSTYPDVPKDSYVFGYLPIGTLPVDLQVTAASTKGRLTENSPHRTNMMRLYNNYQVYPASSSSSSRSPSASSSELTASSIAQRISQKDDSLALDTLLGTVHGTAYLMNNFVFPQDPSMLCHPSPGSPSTNPPWTFPEHADLTGATVLCFAPGAKTAVLFAHLLKHQRREGTRPRQVVGISSESSRPFVVTTGLYDDVALTGENPLDVVTQRLGLGGETAGSGSKIVVVDFGGRNGVASSWVAALRPQFPNLVYSGIGMPVEGPPASGTTTTAGAATSPDDAATAVADSTAALMGSLQKNAMLGCVMANTDDIIPRAVEALGGGTAGEEKYLAAARESWDLVREHGVRGFGVKWGQGMDSVRDGWDALASGGVLPEVGLVFRV